MHSRRLLDCLCPSMLSLQQMDIGVVEVPMRTRACKCCWLMYLRPHGEMDPISPQQVLTCKKGPMIIEHKTLSPKCCSYLSVEDLISLFFLVG